MWWRLCVPRYFFDIEDDHFLSRDPVGMELPGLQEAWETALAVLPDMAREVIPEGDRRDFTSVVREDQRPVFKVSLSFQAEWMVKHP
jgi:hypothetical protein